MKKELTQKDFSFAKWTPSQMKKLADEALAYKKEVYESVKKILPEERTFENTVLALDMSFGSYTDTFSCISILGEVSPKKDIRDAAFQIQTDISKKMVDLEYDRGLYIAVLEYVEGNFADEKKKLRKEDIKLTEESIREYKRAGFDKDEKTQKEIKALLKKIGTLGHAFGKNINDYTDYILCTKEELDGLSDNFIASLPIDEKTGKYIVTLAYPHLFPFLSEATNRKKRKELAEKNLQKGGKNNLKIINEIISLREKLAKLLGYANHADYRTENRMAKSGKAAALFQDTLLSKVAPLAKSDMKNMKDHAKSLGITDFDHYDMGFASTSLKKKLYDIDPEKMRAFFPLPHVLDEMFALAQELFGITLVKKDLPLWHKDVSLYELRDEASLGSNLIGYLAMDLYPREGKFGHAMCSPIVHSRELSYKAEEMLTPVTAIVCNFRAPRKLGKKVVPSLLSLGEVETLYHEFGHSLHSLLSEVKLMSFSGTNVAWDFVETPSQFMENFVWNKEALHKLSSHYETGEKLGDEMIQKILGSKKFNGGYQVVRQLIYGKVDLDTHTGKVSDMRAAYIAMNKKYFGITLPENKTLFPASYGHMVGYDAGYYSYLWALVYAQDAFSLFLKKKNDLRSIGMRWRNEVLAKGGSEDEMKLITKFLKRAPNENAFLKELGV